MKQRIVFMGTPAFAAASLDALVAAGLDVAAVVTAPDRPAGRGLQLKASAVKERALALGIPVLQPEKLRDPVFLDALDATGAQLYVVVAFRMLPEVVWCRPMLGTINLHASLLPDLRGAAPINWAIMNGFARTGLTTFFIRHQIDTGDLIDSAPPSCTRPRSSLLPLPASSGPGPRNRCTITFADSPPSRVPGPS
jgi:methionyl-tRNA formyltransferase